MQTKKIPDVQGFITSHALQVFDTLFALKAAPLGIITPHSEPDQVCGSVGFGGNSVTGAVYLHLPEEFATSLAATMLGAEPQSLSEAEVNDVVGELTNMLTGGLKSWLCDSDFPCAVSTPGVIRGRSFAIEAPPDIERLCLEFDADENHFAVEIHVRFEQPQD